MPTQYATNIKELMTLRFVNPATLELIKLNDRGMLTANTQPKTRPVSRPPMLSMSNFQIKIMPIIEVMAFTIIVGIREDGT